MTAQAYDVHAPCDAVSDGGAAAVCGGCFGQGCAGCGGQGSKMATDDMLAISVRQPWAWAICYAGKCIENRDWKRAKITRACNLIGSEILIHAGAGCTYMEFDLAMREMIARELVEAPGPLMAKLTFGAIVARARLADVVPVGAISAHVASPWATSGLTLLVLDNVRPLATPVSFSGTLGFFRVPRAMVPA